MRLFSVLLGHPSFLLPTVVGLTFCLAGWAIDMSLLRSMGYIGLLLGIGCSLIRLSGGIEKLMIETKEYEKQTNLESVARKLKNIELKLRGKIDRTGKIQFRGTPPRRDLLDSLFALQSIAGVLFSENFEDNTGLQVDEKLEKLLFQSIGLLDKIIDGNYSESIHGEIKSAIQDMRSAISRKQEKAGGELSRLREDLNATLQISKRVEEQMKDVNLDVKIRE